MVRKQLEVSDLMQGPWELMAWLACPPRAWLLSSRRLPALEAR